VNGVNRGGEQSRGSPHLQTRRSASSLVAMNAAHGFSNPAGQTNQSQIRARTLQEIETEMLLNAQRQRQERERVELLQQELEQQRQEREREELLQQELEQQRLARQQHFRQQQLQQEQQLLLQQQDRLREQEVLRQRTLYQQDQLQLQRHRLMQQQQQRELQQQHTPPPRMMHSQSPRFIEQQQRQFLLLQHYEEQQRRLQLEEQLRREDQLRREELERQMLSMNLERSRVESPAYNGNRLQGNTQAQVHEAQRLQQAYERQLQLQQNQQRRQSSRSPAVANSARYPAAEQQERHTQDNAMQQRLLAELVAHGDLAADIHGISKADQEALRIEAMRKIVEAERMEEKRRRKAAKIAHMVRATVTLSAKLIIFI